MSSEWFSQTRRKEPTSSVLAFFTCNCSEWQTSGILIHLFLQFSPANAKWLSQTSGSLLHLFWQFLPANPQSGSLRPAGAYFTASGSFHLQMFKVALSDHWEPPSPVQAVLTFKCSEWLAQTSVSLFQLFWQFPPANA